MNVGSTMFFATAKVKLNRRFSDPNPLQVLSFVIDDDTGEPLDGVPATVHVASRFESVVGQEDALRIQAPPRIRNVFGKSIIDSEAGAAAAGQRSVFGGGCGLFGGGGGIFGGSAKSTVDHDEQTTCGPSTMCWSSDCTALPLSEPVNPNKSALANTGCHAENEQDHPSLVLFSRGHKAAQRCFQLIKIFAIPKPDTDEFTLLSRKSGVVAQLAGCVGTADRFASAGWNLDGLRTIAGIDGQRRIVDECVARLENERRARFGIMASLILDASVSTVGVSTRTASSVEGDMRPEKDDSDRRTLPAIADDVADASSRFVTEFELFRRSASSGLTSTCGRAGGPGEVAGVKSAADEKDEFRAAGPRFSPKHLLAFLGLGKRIERSLRLLARRADEVDDVPLQIVVTSMNGDDLLKHDTTVFLSCVNSKNRATIADLKDLVRKNVQEHSRRERELLEADDRRLVGALAKEFWAAVGRWDWDGDVMLMKHTNEELQKRLADGFQEVIFEEPVTTLECGRGHLVLAVGFYLTERTDKEVTPPQLVSELRLVPVLYFLHSAEESHQGGSFYWSGNQLLNFMLGAENGRWHRGRRRGVPPVLIRAVKYIQVWSSIFEDEQLSCREGSTKPTSLIFDRGVEAATAAHAKMTSLLASAQEPVIRLFTEPVSDGTPFSPSDIHNEYDYDGEDRHGDESDIHSYWLHQSGVSKLKRWTSSPQDSSLLRSVFQHWYTRQGGCMQWNVAVLDQLTAGQSAETDRKLRAEIDSARLLRCPDFIRAQAENDDATALDRLEIIPYGSTDICGDDITLLDLVQKEEYDAEFSDADPTGKTVATVRFHAVLRAAALPPREGEQAADGGDT